jgi:protein-tyrosine phosphatase
MAVLFVCLGNICRSPMAEGAFRAAATRHGFDCHVDSAGTASYHIGHPPDPRAIATAQAYGVEIAGQRARQIERNDFYSFTHIFAMDTANLAGIRSQAPRDATARIGLFLDAVEGRGGEPIKDPYYGDESDFDAVWKDVELAAEAVVARLLREGAEARF